MTGTLYGLGVGPGDPELLTLKAVRLIEACPVLAYPAPLEGEGMARKIASAHISLRKTEIPLRMAMGKNRASAIAAYAKGAERIAAHLDAGHDVGVLCEGDPLLFGSFIYLMEILEDRYPIAIVPGISSVMAGAAALKTPLTKGDESLAVLPASRPQEDIARALRSADTVVLLKAGKHLSKIAMVLERLGLADKARYVEHVGWESQQVRPFAEAAAEGGPYFSLVVVRP